MSTDCGIMLSQVAELESVFQLLRQEVERLFLQAPSVDLDALGSQLNQAEGMIDEQGSIVQVGSVLCLCSGRLFTWSSAQVVQRWSCSQ